jgi:uncharacterized membrane protein YhiD involved in acid resistance
MILALIAADLLAVAALIALFLSRHRRRDLVVAYLGMNIGVLAVTAALSSMTASVGLGLGLFGVLSIVRLRSEELNQTEVAHYFASLALGLLAGLGATQPLWAAALIALVLLAVYVGDHPAVSRRTRRQDLLLDRAHTDHTSLRAHVERVLGCEVVDLAVRRTDLVNDTTLVSVTTVDAPAAKAPRVTSVEVTR